MTERDFLYQRRLVSFRPFVTDDGVPGLNLRFEGDDMIAVRIESPLLDILHQAISRLRESPRIKLEHDRIVRDDTSFDTKGRPCS